MCTARARPTACSVGRSPARRAPTPVSWAPSATTSTRARARGQKASRASPTRAGAADHRTFGAAGRVEGGRERVERMRPIAERHGLTMLQLACAWNLAHAAVASVVPTLIQEAGPDAKPVETKRAEVAAVPAGAVLAPEEVEAIRVAGDNTGGMALKGGSPDHEGESRPDRWALDERLAADAARRGIDPVRDLAQSPAPAASTGSPAARQA